MMINNNTLYLHGIFHSEDVKTLYKKPQIYILILEMAIQGCLKQKDRITQGHTAFYGKCNFTVPTL